MSYLVDEITKIARLGGDIMLNADRNTVGVDSKAGKANFVTQYDLKVQNLLEKELLSLLPEARFAGEEKEDNDLTSLGYVFIVDPIDGTQNFIKDYKCSCISIGLLKDGKPYIGVVFNPYMNEMFTAEYGKGAYCNGKPIHVSDCDVESAIVLFGTAPYYPELHKQSLEIGLKYLGKSLDLRRSGSAAHDLCDVASGRAEFFFELRLSPWDYAAGCLILREAGGFISTMDGEEVTFDKKQSIFASNSKCADEVNTIYEV